MSTKIISPNRERQEISAEVDRICDAMRWRESGDIDVHELARQLVDWQKSRDESRRLANVRMSNTDVPKDGELEVAFEDIWSGIVPLIEQTETIEGALAEKLKRVCHEFFEAGKVWQEKRMLDSAVVTTRTVFGLCFPGDVDRLLESVPVNGEVKVIICQELK